MKDLLKQYFGLDEDPFDPVEDPNTGFRFEGYSLTTGLNIYEQEELRRYFVEAAFFGECLDQAKQFLRQRGRSQAPPVFLIEGQRDSGVESLYNYVAWLIAQQHAPGPKPRFEIVKLANEDFAEWLNNIRLVVETHIDESKVPGCQSLIGRFQTEIARAKPSEGTLIQLFTMLAGRLKNAPWLILVLQPITFNQQERIDHLCQTLTPINVVPIFITSDRKVTQYFKATQQGKGLSLTLKPLAMDQGIEVLKKRISMFRKHPPAGESELFPYEQDAVQGIFADGEKVIGFFLDTCHGTLAIKLEEIAEAKISPGNLAVTWEHVKRYYEERLRRAVPKRAI